MKERRAYAMGARADAVAETRRRILRAVVDLAQQTLDLDPTLDAVATQAGVSVQTLLRHFGSRDALFDAAVELASSEVVAERETPVGDVPAAVRTIVDHYESRGDFVLRLLAHEHEFERIGRVVAPGRRLHRTWVSEVFAPYLPAPTSSRDTRQLVDLLVVATDVYTWKLLRRDAGLSRANTEARMIRLVNAVLMSQGEPA